VATPPLSDPPGSDLATRAFSAAGPRISTLRGMAGRVRLPHARRHRSTARRITLAVFAGLATLAILLTLDGIWAGRTMFRGVSSARSALTEGAVAVVTGDPQAAVPHFEHAASAADSALDASGHPSISLLGRLPWLGDNLGAVEAVAQASRSSADAGMAMVEAARILDWRDLRLPAAEAIGAVDLAKIEQATPAIDRVASELGAAAARLEAADTGRLVGPVASGYDDALETLQRRAAIALDTRDFMEVLPRFLGGGARRRYLLAIQTLGRPQGTGGEVDLVGVLSARDGVMTLSSALTPAGEAFAATTTTTDARAAGANLMAAATDAGFGKLDGVVLADSLWLADALWTTGSVEVADRALPVNSDQAAKVLEREVFEARDAGAAATRRAEVATAIVESYLARRPATEAFAVALARDVAEQDLVIVASKPRDRRMLEGLGAGGTSRAPARQAVSVTWDTVVDNHAAVFTRREVSHRVVLEADGSARVRTVVSLVNEAPDGPPSALLGFDLPATVPEPAGVNPVGGWAADVGVAIPRKAERITAETSIPSETTTAKDEGSKSVVARLAADPGDSMSLTVSYRMADAKTVDGIYRVLVTPQPAWPAGVVRVRIDAPPGVAIAEASEEFEVGGLSARYVGTPTRPFVLWVRFA